jgi:heme-degrading monooxygenase HmoA
MFVRLTFCKFAPEAINEVKRIYMKEIAPEVQKQKGNRAIRLMEPVDKADDFISLTEWSTKADADAYEASGLYKSLVGKLASFLTKDPVLRSYHAEDVLATVL